MAIYYLFFFRIIMSYSYSAPGGGYGQSPQPGYGQSGYQQQPGYPGGFIQVSLNSQDTYLVIL
jgi:hypothetical protein